MRPFHLRGDGAPHAVERLEPRRLLAATLLADLNTITAPSEARPPILVGGVGVFYADDGTHGFELWKTDGTPAGTTLLKDINPGPESSYPSSMGSAESLLYFTAEDGTSERQVWRSDGSPEGTIRLTSANGGGLGISGNVIGAAGVVVFGTNQGVMRSDGTAAGTFLIAPLRTQTIARLGDAFYFIGTLLSGGANALWKTDGTASGTEIVRQFSGNVSSPVVAMNGRIYLWAEDGALGQGREPWSSDGTPQGTVPLGNLAAGAGSSAPVCFTTFDGAVYFKAAMPTNPPTARLFRTNGTAGGTALIADVGQSGTDYGPDGLAVYDGALYFSGHTAASGSELWRSDGTAAGTGQFIDLNPGSQSAGPGGFAIYNGRLYFQARTEATGREVFSTDGTVAATRLLKDVAAGTRGSDDLHAPLGTFNGRLYFNANDLVHGRELWSSDGTADGTALLKDIKTWTNGANPGPLTAGPGGFHYFIAKDGRHPIPYSELWKTDGTASGTLIVRQVLNIPPEEIKGFTYANGLLLFGMHDANGLELWRSDGTEAGTRLVKDIAPGSAAGFADPIVKVGDRAFFAARTTSSNEPGLWVSDGSEEGTRVVKPWSNYFALERFSGIDHDGKLLFLASTYTPAEWTEASIYVSDGTLDGTRPVKDGFRNNPAGNWTKLDGYAYFTADTIAAGNELWRSDGTEQGTVMLGDVNPGSSSSSPGNRVATSDWLYFAASDTSNGRELWRVNAQTSQPQRLTSLGNDVDQVRLAAGGRGVIFTTAAGDLYRFDGTNLIALKPASAFADAPALLGADRWFNYFRAGTDASGVELWKTDGTPAGTVLVQDLVPGPLGSYPQDLAVINRKVVVGAIVPEFGHELFVFPSFGALSEETPGPPVALPRGAAQAGNTDVSSRPRIIDLLDDDPPAGVAG